MSDRENLFDDVFDFLDALHEAHKADTNRRRRGGKLKRSFEECGSSLGWPKAMQTLFDDDPLVGYLAAARLCQELTREEKAAVEESGEARREPVLDNGEPAQTELFVQTPIRYKASDGDGAYFRSEVIRAADMALHLALTERVSVHLRYKPNVVVRSLKREGKNARRAQYGGRLYISDKEPHDGTWLATAWFDGHNSYLEWKVPRFKG